MNDPRVWYEKIEQWRHEIYKRIHGYRAEIDFSLAAIFSGGPGLRSHVLYTSYPGLAKSLLVETMAEVSGCTFIRIQLTPDMTPADIRGTEVWRPRDQDFEVFRGPIFARFVLADEINRATPKVQSAFLDAMQEGRVTIGKNRFDLPEPFMVFATRNPIEQEGTYPLPEAQLDRFLCEITFPYPSEEDEILIAKQGNEAPSMVDKVSTPEEISELRRFIAQRVRIDDAVRRYLVNLVRVTREFDPKLIELGASPRATKMFVAMSRAHAFVVRKSMVVIPDDVNDISGPLLRHRLIMDPMQWKGKESEWKTLLKDLQHEASKIHLRSR